MSNKAYNQKDESHPTIALVGRVNVGKSTLFNKLIEDQKAIISDIPGTTRTSNEGLMLWRGAYTRVIDTGGLTFEDEVVFEDEILAQSERAMKEADVILFVVSAVDGLMPQERELAKRMRRIVSKPVILVANKADNDKKERMAQDGEWLKLGLGDPFPVSAASGRNLGDLLDMVYDLYEERDKKPEDAMERPEDDSIDISIIGKPNAGKSSLFNKLIGEDRVIVSEIAHTTREPYDTVVEYHHEEEVEVDIDPEVLAKQQKEADEQLEDGEESTPVPATKQVLQPKTTRIRFVDTAGIRRKTKVRGELERAGIGKSIDAIEDSSIVLFVLDGSQTISQQDMQLGGLLEKRAKSVIILVNKWDLSDDNSDHKRHEVEKMVLRHFPHLDFAPIIFTSALTGREVHKIFPMIMDVWRGRHTVIGVKSLERTLNRITREKLPSRGKGTRHPKLLGMRQVGSAPPVIEVLVKYRTSLHRSYINYMENRLREEYDFTGTAIIMKLSKMKRA